MTGSLRCVDQQRADLFVQTAETVCRLATHPAVAARWSQGSTCAGMTVGGLAHHLTDQLRTTVAFLGISSDEVPAELPLVTLPEFYRLASWVWSGPDDPGHVGLREAADADATAGPEALATALEADLAALRSALADVGGRTPDRVFVPWEGVWLSTADWLLSREVELVVHADDLAASVALPTPHVPGPVAADVLAAMTALAVERHGQVAVVRTIARPQRAPASVEPF